MKKNFLKGISALIAFLMVVLSVPAGALSVSAADIEANGSIVFGEKRGIYATHDNGYTSVLSFVPEVSDYYMFTSLNGCMLYGKIMDENGTNISTGDLSKDEGLKVIAYMEAGKTYYLYSCPDMPVETSYEVFLTNMPKAESVEFKAVTVIQGYDSHVEITDGKQWDKYEFYMNGTVTFEGGISLYVTDSKCLSTFVEINDGQSSTSYWRTGKFYPVIGTIFGVSNTVYVKVISSPVESLTVTDVTLVKDTNGKDVSYTDEHGNEHMYYEYYYRPEYTVTLRDGSTYTLNYNREVVYDGRTFSLSMWDDQSYDNQWDVGENTVHASIMGYETTFKVIIKKAAVESFYVSDVEIIEGTNYFVILPDGFIYYMYNPTYTVVFADGSTETYESWKNFLYEGQYYDLQMKDDQSYKDNWWGVGKHTVKATFMGMETTFTVEIIENPVKEVIVEDVEIIFETEGYRDYYENYIYRYSPKYTLVFNDGHTETFDFDEPFICGGNEYRLYIQDDNQYNENWGVGKHTVKATFMEMETTFTVEITESPIDRFSYVESLTIVEGIDGEYVYDAHWDITWFRYILKPSYTVVFKDGTTKSYDFDDYIEINGKYYKPEIIDFQTCNNPWEVGLTAATILLMGARSAFYVEVVENTAMAGDVDGDEKITTRDVLAIRKALGGLVELTEAQEAAADVDGDGKVTTRDVLKIRKYLGGLIDEL